MTVQNKIDLTLRLPFESAGVEFVIEVGETDGGTTFGLTVEGLELRRSCAVHVGSLARVGRLGEGIHQVAVQGQGLGQLRRGLDLRHVRPDPHV